MSTAYVIEVRKRTAGIVVGNEFDFRFFSSERAFDSLEGCSFKTAADAALAVHSLLGSRKPLIGGAARPESSNPLYAGNPT